MDTVADMLTTLLNAQRVHKKRVAVPYSRHKEEILKLLKEQELIADVRVQESPRGKLVVTLAYDEQGRPRMTGAKRMSTPGRRVYRKKNELPYEYGTLVLSTPQGVLDAKRARKQGVGGELICTVW